MAELDGKVAVVTGGASGIGEATVRQFVEEGAKVVIADMQQERGQNLADELGDAAVFAAVEVRQEEQIKAAIGTAVENGAASIASSTIPGSAACSARSRISQSKSST